ncbi:GNAT family N-acetyltransferase [Kribbella sp. NBC_00382]|uniref:GNAT family N-acetyltransferase n=1 Tax=Kribbella sp. NBC_00382 TaxID=2975967 RepID=UPI002E228775
MELRPFEQGDLEEIVQLTIDTFGPFYEGSFRGLVGDRIFVHQHGDWAGDYRRTVPGLHAPRDNKFVVVAEDSGRIVGYVAWAVEPVTKHGSVELLAVLGDSRREHVGRSLCEAAFAEMRAAGVEVVEIGTGGDEFHAPARAFYESLGLIKVPVAVYFGVL